MRGKETSPVYQEGQEVQIDVGSAFSPEWLNAKVTDTAPKTEHRLLRFWEKLTRIEPIIVEVDKDESTLAGAKIRAYKSGSAVRPKSVG